MLTHKQMVQILEDELAPSIPQSHMEELHAEALRYLEMLRGVEDELWGEEEG